MQLNDSASPFPLTGVRADPFDLLDLASNLIVEAMQTAAHRRVRTADVPSLLHEIATHVEQRLDGSGDDISLHYLAARLRESANIALD